MSDTNCNCCGCQYSTPPWWVTMGFLPPNNSHPVQVQQPAAPPSVNVPNPGISLPGVGVTVPPPPSIHVPQPGPGINLPGIGGLGNVIGNPIGTATTVVSDIVNGIGGLLGKLF